MAVIVLARSSRAPEPVAVGSPPAQARISVHVAGEVTWPGLYVLPAGSRVQDAIFAAHGPTYLADLRRLNLAAPLRDGDRVVIPRIVHPAFPSADSKTSAGARSPQETAGGPPAGEPGPTVNVNTATAEDLERLPGVGPVLARRIVEFREARGLFRRMEDLLEVDGIGPKTLRRLAPMLRLE